MTGESSGTAFRHGPGLRTLLSAFFLLNFGSVLVYHLPSGRPDVPGIPPLVTEPLEAVLPPLKVAAWPVARRYMDATATRQRWTLFAPYPAEWNVSLDVKAFYPKSGHGGLEGAEAAEGERADRAMEWVVDSIRVEGAREVPYPHWFRHRSFRIVFNMGYERWGDHYRPVYARHLCRTLRDERGVAPDGVSLTARWTRTTIPWRDEEPETYEQFLGGFSCFEVLDEEPPSHLKEAGS